MDLTDGNFSISLLRQQLRLSKNLDLCGNSLENIRLALRFLLQNQDDYLNRLESLNVSHIQISSPSIRTSVRAYDQKLTSQCVQSDQIIVLLSELLMKTDSLCELRLQGNSIGSNGVLFLARALGKNRSLAMLDLSDNLIDTAALHLILTNSPNLLRLNVLRNHIEFGAQWSHVENLLSSEYLSLESFKVFSENVSEVENAIKRNVQRNNKLKKILLAAYFQRIEKSFQHFERSCYRLIWNYVES
jgi:hypothetical protein